MQEIIVIAFQLAVLLMSVVLHEISHGYAAEALGDPTARMSGRLTLNPIKHLDPVGSVILPLFLAFAGAPIFGWARPVPYNPYNLGGGKYGPGLVAAAGPLTNIFLAVFFGLAIRFFAFTPEMLQFVGWIVGINLILALFNLIPFPPLDGSKVVASLLPYRLYRHWASFEVLVSQYGLIFLALFFILAFNVFIPLLLAPLSILFSLLTGYPLGIIL